jgi:hypothetical protein
MRTAEQVGSDGNDPGVRSGGNRFEVLLGQPVILAEVSRGFPYSFR